MTAWASALVLAASVLFRFQDPGITESSSLVLHDGLYITANDSGDSARVFAVDAAGATVGVTTYGADVVDVEAMAADGNDLLVGDIGDNEHVRSHITVYRIPMPGRGTTSVSPTAYDLVYADGPRDAETLLVQPRTGRLYVVSKGVLGGTVYAAPKRLRSDRTNVLQPVGTAPGLVTDGSFFTDGRHAVLRDYSRAFVVDGKDFSPLASFPLPDQEQGEGIAIDRDHVLVSSEGEHAPVESKQIPRRLLRAMEPAETPPADGDTTSTDAKQDDVAWVQRFVPLALGAGWLLVLAVAFRWWRQSRSTT